MRSLETNLAHLRLNLHVACQIMNCVQQAYQDSRLAVVQLYIPATQHLCNRVLEYSIQASAIRFCEGGVHELTQTSMIRYAATLFSSEQLLLQN